MDIPVNYIQAVSHEIMRAILTSYVSREHQLTGKFVQSLKTSVTKEDGDIVIQVSGLAYGIYLNRGVLASSIKKPFAKPRIDGLKEWCKLRLGMDDKEATQRAFAIAYKQSKEGFPARYKGGSKFLEEAAERSMPKIKETTKAYVFDVIQKELYINNLFPNA